MVLDRNERGAASRNTVETAENKDGRRVEERSGEEKRDNTRSVNQSHAAPDNQPTTILHRSDHLSLLHYNVRPLSLSLGPSFHPAFTGSFPLSSSSSRQLGYYRSSIYLYSYISLALPPSSFNLSSPHLPFVYRPTFVRSIYLVSYPRFPLSLSASRSTLSLSLSSSISVYFQLARAHGKRRSTGRFCI